MFRYLLSILALVLLPLATSGSEKPLHLVTDDWPPYEFLDPDSGRISGLSTEIILAVFQRMQVTPPRMTLLPWARAQREALAGSVDGIFSISNNEERRRYLHYPSEPLAIEPGVLFVQREKASLIKVNSLDDLKTLRIGVIRGYAYSPELWQALNDFGNFSALTQEGQLFKMLSLDRFDAVVSYRRTGVNMLNRLDLEDQLVALDNFVLFEHHFFLAFNKATVPDRFVADFAEHLAAFKQEPDYQKLVQQYAPD